jgi:peroxiredoxin
MFKLIDRLRITTLFMMAIALGIAGCSAPPVAEPVPPAKISEVVKPPPPLISNVRVSKASDSSAWVTWGTDRPTTTEVTYWEEGTEKRTTVNNDEINTIHVSTVQPIQKEKNYAFTIKARDSGDPQVVSGYQGVFSIKTGSMVSQYAPDFKLQLLNDEYMVLSQFLGRSVLLVFWDITCSVCQKKMPMVQKKFNQLDSNKLAIVAVHISGQVGEINSYCVDHGITLPVLLDLDGKVGAAYDVGGIPATFFIDKFGVIRARNPEFNTQEELDKLIDQYLSG